jgi:glycosyltransferase involved in cell wall biosynthesis
MTRLRGGVTVLIPVRNEASFIGKAVASVQAAAEGVPGLEIIVIDGMSDDETWNIAAELAACDPRIRLLANPHRTVPHAMNLGIEVAAGEVIIRIDGHAEIMPDFVRNALAELEAHPECACVGGPIENVSENSVADAISNAMSSTFGVGNARFRTGGQDGYVDTLAFGAYRKADLLAVGLFDEALTRNEDDELNYRLVRAGRKIWFSNSIRSRYYVRSSFSKLYRQYFQYGYWKVYVNRKHGSITSLRQIVPPLFVGTIGVLALLLPVLIYARVSLTAIVALYFSMAAVFALRAEPQPLRVPAVVAAFVVLHAGYGLGYWAGVRDFAVLRRQPTARSAELTR